MNFLSNHKIIYQTLQRLLHELMFFRLHNYKHVGTVIVMILNNLSILKVNTMIQYGFDHVTNSYHFELFNLLNISKSINQSYVFVTNNSIYIVYVILYLYHTQNYISHNFFFLLNFNNHVTVFRFLLLNILNQNIVMCTDCRPGGPSTFTLLSYVLGKV